MRPLLEIVANIADRSHVRSSNCTIRCDCGFTLAGGLEITNRSISANRGLVGCRFPWSVCRKRNSQMLCFRSTSPITQREQYNSSDFTIYSSRHYETILGFLLNERFIFAKTLNTALYVLVSSIAADFSIVQNLLRAGRCANRTIHRAAFPI